MKLKTKKIALASVIVWVVSAIIGWLTCGWLFKGVYQIPQIIWKSPEIIMAAGNTIGSLLVGLISAIIFVTVFAILYKGIPGKGINKGLNYGLLLWAVSAFSGILTMIFYMTISPVVIIYWILQALVVNLIIGVIVAKIYK